MSKIPSYYEVASIPGDLSSLLKEGPPRFNPGDIVYVLFNPTAEPSATNPVIGSPYEIDCKVLSVSDKNGSGTLVESRAVTYQLMTGHGVMITKKGAFLVHAKDYHANNASVAVKTVEETELCPKDTVFARHGDYFCNETFGIYIHVSRMDELINEKIVKPK